MTAIKTIMSWLEGLAEPDWQMYHSDGEAQFIAKETLDNRCIVCGAVIPEGRYVCPNCEKGKVIKL